MKNQRVEPGYLFSKGYTNYIFVLLFLLYMFDYIDRMVVTSMFTFIEAEWGISHTQSGMLVSAVYWSIVLLTFPVSILVDRWSRKKTIGIMAVLWSMATLLCALTGNFTQLFLEISGKPFRILSLGNFLSKRLPQGSHLAVRDRRRHICAVFSYCGQHVGQNPIFKVLGLFFAAFENEPVKSGFINDYL